MFAKPESGKSVRVTTDWSDLFATSVYRVPIKPIVGTVIESDHYDDPASFRLLTSNTNFPVSVVPLERVTELTYSDGTEAATSQQAEQVDEETWEVQGSKESYIVSRKGTSWHCECKGWQFRQQCKHVNEKKAEVLAR